MTVKASAAKNKTKQRPAWVFQVVLAVSVLLLAWVYQFHREASGSAPISDITFLTTLIGVAVSSPLDFLTKAVDLGTDLDFLIGALRQTEILKKNSLYRSADNPRFSPVACDSTAGGNAVVDVAIVGGGISGLTAAYTFLQSNERRERECGLPVEKQNVKAPPAPFFNITLFEKEPRLGGHSWTVNVEGTNTTNGEPVKYPVDVAYAWTPLIEAYGSVRKLYRKHGLRFTGPLANAVKVYTDHHFNEVSDAEEEQFDGECDKLNKALQHIMGGDGLGYLPGRDDTLRTTMYIFNIHIIPLLVLFKWWYTFS